MNRRSIIALTTSVFLGLWIGSALAQPKTLKEQLVGTWLLVSNTVTNPDGTKTETWGPNPRGIMVYDGTGHFTVTLTRSDMKNIVANDRTKGTDAENKVIVSSSSAYFGTYTVDDANSITWKVEGSTYPNWVGSALKRTVAIAGDELTLGVPTSSGGGMPLVVIWRRAK
jgi:hypothetical protein